MADVAVCPRYLVRERGSESTFRSSYHYLLSELYDHVFDTHDFEFEIPDLASGMRDLWCFFPDAMQERTVKDDLLERDWGSTIALGIDAAQCEGFSARFTLGVQEACEEMGIFPAYPFVPILSSYDFPRDYAVWVSTDHKDLRVEFPEREEIWETHVFPQLLDSGISRLIIGNGHTAGGLAKCSELPRAAREMGVTWTTALPRNEYLRLLSQAGALLISNPRQRSASVPMALGYGVPVVSAIQRDYAPEAYADWFISTCFRGWDYEAAALGMRDKFGYDACIRRVARARDYGRMVNS